MIKNVIFDCDSTLTHTEGIDHLADMNDVWEEVSAITRRSMESTSLTVDVFDKRLELVSPTLEQVQDLGDLYIANLTRDVKEVINLLKESGRNVFILTGGLQPAVGYLARYLGIGYKNVYSVEVYFNQVGEYEGFDKSSPLVNGHGKAKIAKEITEKYGKSVLVGDGANDSEAANELELFIGYGGAVRRKNVLVASDIYIECNSFAPLIPILMDEEELEQYRKGQYRDLIDRGKNLLSDSVVRKS